MRLIKATNKLKRRISVFLAGTIDNGAARDWQSEVTAALSKYNVDIYNPHRNDWNSNASPTDIEDQIKWELTALDRADIIAMWFEPNSKSPITLLEFGMFVRSGKLVVGCPSTFYRYQNVQTTCDYNSVTLRNSISWLIEDVQDRIKSLQCE